LCNYCQKEKPERRKKGEEINKKINFTTIGNRFLISDIHMFRFLRWYNPDQVRRVFFSAPLGLPYGQLNIGIKVYCANVFWAYLVIHQSWEKGGILFIDDALQTPTPKAYIRLRGGPEIDSFHLFKTQFTNR
jgi:hypothetical protein